MRLGFSTFEQRVFVQTIVHRAQSLTGLIRFQQPLALCFGEPSG